MPKHNVKPVLCFSGGKDSCYSMMQCVAHGHDIVALANLRPRDGGQYTATVTLLLSVLSLTGASALTDNTRKPNIQAYYFKLYFCVSNSWT